MKHWLVSIFVCWAAVAHAQGGDVLQPVKVTPAQCLAIDTTPGAPLGGAPAADVLAMPEPWTDFTVEGELVDPPATVHALLEPTMAQYRTSLTPKAWVDIGAAAAKYGYQLVTHSIDEGKIKMRLEPLPIVRAVHVSVKQGYFERPLDDDIRRRMRLRTGSLLPWGTNSPARQCAMLDEETRIREYLRDEGFFDAEAKVLDVPDGTRDNLVVEVTLGPEFHIGKTTILPGPNQLAIPDTDIAAMFKHQKCFIGEKYFCYLGPARFTRSRYQEDLGHLRDKFHELGYDSVRIQSSAMTNLPGTFDRRTRTVNPVLTVDQRRHTFVDFTGPYSKDAITDEQLRKELTFAEASSADDVEAANSARAIQAYLQTRGFFDAHVTWSRERLDVFDRVTFTLDPGDHRETRSVQFTGNHALSTDELAGIVAVKAANLAADLLGTQTNATSEKLSTDIDRIVEAYRRAGYREARASVSASPDAAGLDDPAMTAALLQLGAGETGLLYVRYTIDEGRPTILKRIVLEHADKGKQLDPALCDQMLTDLATELNVKLSRQGCTATVDVPFREDDVLATRDGLRAFLFKKGRPRAVVDYTTIISGDHEVTAHYAIRGLDPLRIGKIIIRGNFRTKDSVIRAQLAAAEPRFGEGAPLTADALAEAARQLRTTTLFSAVNIEMPDLATDSDVVNAIVRVEERYDYFAQVELSGGYSSYNGAFGTTTLTDSNIAGRGILLSIQGTLGQKLIDANGRLVFPKWLLAQFAQAEVSGRYTEQETPRFGLLTTEGFTTGLTWQKIRQRTPYQAPWTQQIGLHYDFRLRSRNVDALRPVGADLDNTQVAVSTRTGAIGVTAIWEARRDRAGSLSPLAPEDGYRLEASGALYMPELGGQDTFVKVSAAASKFIPIGKNLTIRGDFRYDEGFPLRGAALLPDVERFFAGGDTTVRGYEDDRLATEIEQVGVPPVAGISQIRVIPAGGNIRVLASVDAQLRIWKFLAGAAFSDAGMIANQWGSVTVNDIRPSVGTGLRFLTPFGILAIEYAVPIRPHLGDDPRGRTHFYFAARAQF